MSIQKVGYSLIGIGILVVLFMLFVDLIGLGNSGIQAAQLLGMEGGAFIIILGYFLVAKPSRKNDTWAERRTRLARALSSPAMAILVGVLAGFFVFSIIPMFLNTDLRFQYFNRYLPDKYPIGLDLQTLLGRIETWFEIGTPYPGDIPQFYPPLTYAFFSPLTLLDYPSAYLTMTLVTLISYVFLTLLMPIWMNSRENHAIVFFLFAISLFSYGLQFELERGQYNVLIFLFCILAVYIHHFHHTLRHIAYLLFSIAVQLKVFPAIFIFMFIRDWKDWKGNIKRLLGLGLFNIALLFILGPRVVIDFLNAISRQVVAPTWNWNGNHSIQAFVFNLMKDGYGLIQPDALASLRNYSSLITAVLLVIFAVCLVSLLVTSYRRNEGGLNPYLLMVCTIGALTIPTSNDYTLSFLTAPVAILLSGIPIANAFRTRYLASLLIAILSFAFSSTLFPFKYKPYFLNNNFPALFVILIAVTLLYFLRNRSTESERTTGRS